MIKEAIKEIFIVIYGLVASAVLASIIVVLLTNFGTIIDLLTR